MRKRAARHRPISFPIHRERKLCLRPKELPQWAVKGSPICPEMRYNLQLPRMLIGQRKAVEPARHSAT